MMFFKQRPISESYHGGIETVEHDGLALAIHESMCEYETEISAKLPVAISNVYEMYICDTSRTTEQKVALLEGVLGDAWEKIKAFFKKIAAKLKSWWNSVVKYFQTVFSSNKKFLEKFKDEIEGKDTEKFTYTGYEYSGIKKMDAVDNIIKEIINQANASTKAAGDNADKFDDKVPDWKQAEKEKKKEMDQIAMKIAKGDAGYEGKGNASKFKDSYIKSVRGSSEKKEIKNFSKGMSVSDMIDYLENGDDKLSDVKQLNSDVTSAADDFADAVDTLRGKIKDSSEDAAVKTEANKALTYAANVMKYSLSYGTAACDAQKQLLSEIISQSNSVLRSLARYKPAKENFMPSSNNGSSLLEAFSAGF